MTLTAPSGLSSQVPGLPSMATTDPGDAPPGLWPTWVIFGGPGWPAGAAGGAEGAGAGSAFAGFGAETETWGLALAVAMVALAAA